MSDEAQTIEFTIRLEIQDWFKKRLIETFGSYVQLQYLSNDEHFDIYTSAELTTSKNTIRDVIKFIENTSDLLEYKMPWLSDNIYYHDEYIDEKIIKQKLSTQAKHINFTTTGYHIIGCVLSLFNFPPDLNDTEKMKLDKIFKTLPHCSTTLFLTYPKIRTAQHQSPLTFETNILMGYHGSYLQYLDLEDIISLEIANYSQETDADAHLDHDIQKFLRSKYPVFYKNAAHWDLTEFKINEVLRHFIHKYHNRVKKIYISNILTTNEIQSLSQSYNIEIVCHNLIHIDFKTAHESIDFCAIYHFDPRSRYFINYNSQYASENHTMNFNANDSLEPLTCGTKFTNLVIKSQNSCPPAKTNSVLKCVTDHFIASGHFSMLILYEFDLNHVLRPILGSLVKLMAKGVLKFHKMNFNLETLSDILEQSAKNFIIFKNCHIPVEKLNRFRINSQKIGIQLLDMDIDQNLLYSLNNLELLEVTNCRILTTNVDVLIELKMCSSIAFKYTSFSVTTLVQLLNGLRSVRIVIFESCKLTTNDLVKTNILALTNRIRFNNMTFQTNTFFQIFKKFKAEDGLIFENCQFLLDDNESYINQLELVNIKFCNIQLDPPTLLTVLGFLNNKSKVWLKNCCISGLDDNRLITKIIKAYFVHFEKCRLETNSLLKILNQMSKTTFAVISCCDVMHSRSPDVINLSTEPEIHFRNTIIESQVARSILQTNSKIIFDNCYFKFTAVKFIKVINASILFLNMRFHSPAQIDWFGNFTHKTRIQFSNCHFELTNLRIPNILIQSKSIYFRNTSFKLKVLLRILRRVSFSTLVFIDGCIIRDVDPTLHISPIRIKDVYSLNMSLQLKTILCIFKDFTSLEGLHFKNCKIVCADPNELPDIKLKSSVLRFIDMNIDVSVLGTLVHKCAKRLSVEIGNCRIVSSGKSSNPLLDIKKLTFKNVIYSQDLLKLLQCLKHDCVVAFSDQLSYQAIIEIITKSPVHGVRLVFDYYVPATFYFELFAEFYRDRALKFELDTNTEYDLPKDIIQRIGNETLRFNEYDWDEFKIKCVKVNDAAVKLEFVRNGKVIDLWFLQNDLPDDSDECIVDYS